MGLGVSLVGAIRSFSSCALVLGWLLLYFSMRLRIAIYSRPQLPLLLVLSLHPKLGWLFIQKALWSIGTSLFGSLNRFLNTPSYFGFLWGTECSLGIVFLVGVWRFLLFVFFAMCIRRTCHTYSSPVHMQRKFGWPPSLTTLLYHRLNFMAIVSWVRSASNLPKINTNCKILLQATVYELWKKGIWGYMELLIANNLFSSKKSSF